jgi:Rrf2 family protein
VFSPSTEYALRALTFLSERPFGALLLNREISQELNLPQAFMHKVMKQLVNAGLLESTRGKKGGFRLTRRPDEVTVYDISCLFDNMDVRDNCILGQEICSDEVPCPLHRTWKKIMLELLSSMKTTTLADMADFGSDMHRAYPIRLPAAELARRMQERIAEREAEEAE